MNFNGREELARAPHPPGPRAWKPILRVERRASLRRSPSWALPVAEVRVGVGPADSDGGLGGEALAAAPRRCAGTLPRSKGGLATGAGRAQLGVGAGEHATHQWRILERLSSNCDRGGLKPSAMPGRGAMSPRGTLEMENPRLTGLSALRQNNKPGVAPSILVY